MGDKQKMRKETESKLIGNVETCLWYQEEEKDAYSTHGRNTVYLLRVLKVFVFCFCAPVETRHRVAHKQEVFVSLC